MKKTNVHTLNKIFKDFRRTKYIKNVLLEDFRRNSGFYYSYLIDYPLVVPDTVQISLTYRCNLKCTMCNVYKLSMEKEMDPQKVYDIIEETAQWGVQEILFLGGEPFLCKNLMRYVAHAGKRGLKTTVVSNGTVIDEKYAQEIARSSLYQLVISLDGAYPQTHDSLRGTSGIHQRVTSNIQQMNRYKKKLGKTVYDQPFISMPATLMAANVAEMYDFVELANQLGVSTVAFQPLLVDNTDLKKQNTQHSQWISAGLLDVLDEMIEKLVRYKVQRRQKQPVLGNSFVHLDAIKKYFRNTHSQEDMKCYAGYTRVVIAPDGNVSLCVESIGNVYEKRIQDMWYSQKARTIRKELKKCSHPCLQFCTVRPQSELSAAVEKLKQQIQYEELSPFLQRFIDKGVRNVFHYWEKQTERQSQARESGGSFKKALHT